MFQPTTPLLGGRLRRLPLTTKVAGRGFYKGNRVGSMGWHTKYGGYIIDYSKVRSYVVPKNLGECKVSGLSFYCVASLVVMAWCYLRFSSG